MYEDRALGNMQVKEADTSLLVGVVMNVFVYSVTVLWTGFSILFLFPPAFLFVKLLKGWDNGRITRLMVWLYGRVWIAVVSPFVKIEREGLGRADVSPPCIFVMNHLSFFDTFFMACLPFSNVLFAIRSWPFKLVWYRYFMKCAGYLDVESMPWQEVLRRAEKALAGGAALFFFPEGHRSRDGNIQEFRSGAFRLACEVGVAIVPLCITGTDTLLPPGRLRLRPARVRIRALPPVSPAGFPGRRGHVEMRRHVKDSIEKNVSPLRAGNG